MLIYRNVDAARDATDCETLFATNGWLGAWRDGIFAFHHFHSTAHEVPGIVAGTAKVTLGGPGGTTFEVARGDVLVLPAGTGHRNAGAIGDLLVVGAYPDGIDWDIRRGHPTKHDRVLANIRTVGVPRADPVGGREVALTELWSAGH